MRSYSGISKYGPPAIWDGLIVDGAPTRRAFFFLLVSSAFKYVVANGVACAQRSSLHRARTSLVPLPRVSLPLIIIMIAIGKNIAMGYSTSRMVATIRRARNLSFRSRREASAAGRRLWACRLCRATIGEDIGEAKADATKMGAKVGLDDELTHKAFNMRCVTERRSMGWPVFQTDQIFVLLQSSLRDMRCLYHHTLVFRHFFCSRRLACT
jgi:hypothetical protein